MMTLGLSPHHPSIPPLSLVVVMLMAIVVEIGGGCQRMRVVSKKRVSNIKKKNKGKKENILDAQRRRMTSLGCFSCCVSRPSVVPCHRAYGRRCRRVADVGK